MYEESRDPGPMTTFILSVGGKASPSVAEAVGALRDFSVRGPQLRAYVK